MIFLAKEASVPRGKHVEGKGKIDLKCNEASMYSADRPTIRAVNPRSFTEKLTCTRPRVRILTAKE